MKTLITIIALALASSTALAANQQVDPDTYRRGSISPFSARSDGLFYHKSYKTPALIGNGDGLFAIGPTYRSTFGYGDGLGAFCESVFAPGDAGFVVANSTNQACDTTCGNAACVLGTDGTDFTTCAASDADGCLCMNAGLDLYGVCGADWEAPALGITRVSLADGTALAHVALLAQDIGPDMDADGLDIAGDQTDNDGVELIGGMYGASGRPLLPGQDPAFFFCSEVTIEDLSGTDEFWVGFRDITAPNATWNDYNSYFAVGLDNTSGDVHTEDEDDGGGTDTDDVDVSAVTESSAHKFCVFVSDTGAATCTSEGESCADTDYTFDSGEPVAPILHFLHGSDVADEVIVSEWVVGFGTEDELRAAGVLQ